TSLAEAAHKANAASGPITPPGRKLGRHSRGNTGDPATTAPPGRSGSERTPTAPQGPELPPDQTGKATAANDVPRIRPSVLPSSPARTPSPWVAAVQTENDSTP